MPVEVAKLVDDFNKLWPRGTDPVSKADDHIRMIKEVLQLEFELLYNKTRVFSFEKGAVVTPDSILYYEAEKAFYQWNGTYDVNNEYIVNAGSTPTTAGGIGGNAWTRSTGSGFMSTVLVSDTEPTAPFQNMLWWDTNSGIFFIYYNDGTSTQWVDLFGIADQASFNTLLFRSILARLAAESGYTLVGGSFQEGAVSSGFSDVVLDWNTAKFYQWHLNENKEVPAGSTPATSGGIGVGAWVDRSDLTLRSEINAIDGAGMIGSMSYAQLRAYSGAQTTANVWGIANVRDGAAGTFKVNVSDTTSADNGGTILVDTTGRRWYRVFTGTINAKWFGAKGDSTTDDTASIQAAVNAVPSTGGSVYVPTGVYKLTTHITMSNPSVTVYGDGWNSNPTSGAVPSGGTVFNVTFLPAVATEVFYITAPHCKLLDFEVFCNYHAAPGAGWAPTTTPAAVHTYRAPYASVGGWDAEIRLMIRGLSTGVFCESDRCEIDLIGQTFGPMLRVDGCFDTMRVKRIHTWVFYSGDTNVLAWQRTNADLVLLGRCDNPEFINVFSFAYKSGITFTSSSRAEGAGTQSMKVANLDVDDGMYGIFVNTNGPISCQIGNFTCYNNSSAGSNTSPSYGIYVAAYTSSYAPSLQIANARILGCGGNAIICMVTGWEIDFGTLRIESYNQNISPTNYAHEAVTAVSGTLITAANYSINSSVSNGGPLFSTAGGVYNFKSSPVASFANPGYEQYSALVSGIPKTITRQFGRATVVVSSPGTIGWSVTLPVSVSTQVLSARASLGKLSGASLTMVDIFDGVNLPTTPSTAYGNLYAAATGTYYVDWEITGY